MKPTFFASPSKFRNWLEKNHAKEIELYLGYYKKHTGKPSLTWQESIDEALCFGWIDGVRRSLGDETYMIRFTPRKPRSNWSAVNIARVAELTKRKLMKPAGLAVFKLREEKRSKIYTYEREVLRLSHAFETKLKANKNASAFFRAQALSYKKSASDWVMRAVREETRLRRLEILIKDCQAGRKIKPLSYDKKSRSDTAGI